MSSGGPISVKSATTIITSSISTKGGAEAEAEFAKNAIAKLKNSNITEKNELKRLNFQLENYLANVRALENLNKRLLEEVERAREAALPKVVDKSRLDESLEIVRHKLEDESNEAVRHQARIEESESLIQHISQRLRFFQNEADIHKNKIAALQAQLAEINNQREYLLKSAQIAQEDIAREQNRIAQSEKDLDNLRLGLRNNRSNNKKIEFELQTILDEIEFRKALFNEEINDMRTRLNALKGLSGPDLANFYKTELANAIRQIRQDFQQLSDQQLAEYKEHKEAELKLTYQRIEEEKNYEKQLKAKLEASKDLELQSSRELKSSIDGNRSEMAQLGARNLELSSRLSSLESALEQLRSKNSSELERKQAEIDALREQNKNYANELDYWDRVTRIKLEQEIATYRTILNSQIRLMQTTSSTSSSSSSASASVSASAAQVVVDRNPRPSVTSTRDISSSSSTVIINSSQSRSEIIGLLRQVFNNFDSDRTGRINSSELDNVLSRLNVRLSREGYQQILREADRDLSRDLDFDEFLKIMLPVFTGKFTDDELYYAFKKFDLDNSGYITIDELRRILSKIGQHFSELEISRMVSSVDTDRDGRLNFPEFARLMKSPRYR